MNKRFLPDELQRVKDSADIVDIVGQFVVLKKAGIRYKGLSPFKDEKTPSFFVNTKTQRFEDYSANLKGDVFEFLVKLPQTNCKNFVEAVEWVAKYRGIHLTSMDKQSRPKVFKDRVLEINQWACQWFANQMWSDPEEVALDYLRVRGFEDATIRKRMFGFAPKGYSNLLDAARNAGFNKEELQYASLVNFSRKGKYYDTFRNRLMFPIKNLAGEVISFGGRILDEEERMPDGEKPPKYINGRVNTLYKKNKILYGMDVAKNKIREFGEAWLVEGYLDVEACHQAGLLHVVATCGTNITSLHGNEIMKYAGKVMTMLDADAGGWIGTVKGVDNLLAAYPDEEIKLGKKPEFRGLEVSICNLPDGEDPQDYLVKRDLKKQAEDLFNYVLQNKRPFLNSLVDQFVTSKEEATERLKGIQQVAKTISFVRDNMLRKIYIEKASSLTGQDIYDLTDEVQKNIDSRSEGFKKMMAFKRELQKVGAGERELLRLVISNYGEPYGNITFQEKVIQDLESYGFAFCDWRMNNILDCITALSANHLELNMENISKMNRRAGQDIHHLLDPLKLEEMRPSVVKPGYDSDMVVILNNYKKYLVNMRIEQLTKIPKRDAEQDRRLVRLNQILQEFMPLPVQPL